MSKPLVSIGTLIIAFPLFAQSAWQMPFNRLRERAFTVCPYLFGRSGKQDYSEALGDPQNWPKIEKVHAALQELRTELTPSQIPIMDVYRLTIYLTFQDPDRHALTWELLYNVWMPTFGSKGYQKAKAEMPPLATEDYRRLVQLPAFRKVLQTPGCSESFLSKLTIYN